MEEIRSSRKILSGDTRALGNYRENLVLGDSRKKQEKAVLRY